MTRTNAAALAVIIATVLTAGLASAAEAAGRGGSVVTACSRYGNGCYSAPVRPGKWGHEMRLRSGTWIDCEGDCQRTLREQKLDFFETLNENSP